MSVTRVSLAAPLQALPSEEIVDPVVETPGTKASVSSMATSQYLSHQAGTDRPERLSASSDLEARALVRRRVISARGNTTIFLYKLIGVERFVPSSEYIEFEKLDFQNGKCVFPTDQDSTDD